MRHRRRRYVRLALALGVVILALGCGVGALAVREGALRPPYIQFQVGGMRLVGLASVAPDCKQMPIAACTQLEQIPTARIYRIWLLVQREPGTWSQAHTTELLAIPVSE